jgi:hypothetical protein
MKKINNHPEHRSKQFLEDRFIRENTICLAFDVTDCVYYRVQIAKVENKKKILCFYLDVGKSKHFCSTELFLIDESLLKLKFQVCYYQDN